MTLAMFGRNGTSSPQVAEGLAVNPLAARSLDSVVDYVLTGLVARKIQVDARWQGENKLQTLIQQQGGNSQDMLAQLQEMLEQLHFKAQLPTTQTTSALIAAQRDALTSMPDGQTADVTVPPEFQPGLAPPTLTVGDQGFTVEVLPIAARPSLNHLPYAALWAYLRRLGLSTERAKALAAIVVEWRGDKSGDWQGDGAGGWYAARPRPYALKGKPFETWDELFALKGVGDTEAALLHSHFVLHGLDRGVIPEYFSVADIAALADLPEDTVVKALAWRQEQSLSSNERHELADVIGLRDAERFAVAIAGPESLGGPVIVRVTSLRARRDFVYDPKTKAVVEDLE